jgi:hypothetical protein
MEIKMLRTSLKAIPCVVLLAGLSTAVAEERILVVEGTLEPGQLSVTNNFPVDNYESITGFRTEITFETDLMIYRDIGNELGKEFDNDGYGAIKAIEVFFLDANDDVVPQTVFPTSIPIFEPQGGSEGNDYDFQFQNFFAAGEDQIDSDRRYQDSNPERCYIGSVCSVSFTFDVFEEALPFVVDDGQTVVPVEYFGDAAHSSRFNYNLMSFENNMITEASIGFDGVLTHTIYLTYPDTDNDGVTDNLDQCVVSLADETVMFGEYDSNVTNYVDESGCTIMDHYAACEADQEEQGFTRRSFSFYRGPSYCEKQVAYGLVSDGIIDYSEARMLRDALYRSHR